MKDFMSGEIDVLVSTTIIETGLDIPNVNTIIIEDSQRYGLAQLYQLRGRVGRSNRTAYAFLMYKRNSILKEQAEKRLLLRLSTEAEPLEPVDIVMRSPYRSERDAMHLLTVLENGYEPVKLFGGRRE